MCWSYEISLITGISASVISIYLLVNGKGNDIPVAFLSLSIALMQFAEALIWKGVNLSNPQISTHGAHLGIISLLLQPLVLGLSTLWIRGISVLLLGAFIFIWIITSIPIGYKLLQQTWNPQPGCNGHLQWPFLKPFLESPFAVLYWIVMFGAWMLFRPFSEGFQYTIIAITTWLVTWKLFPGEWGTLWCFIANILPLGRLI